MTAGRLALLALMAMTLAEPGRAETPGTVSAGQSADAAAVSKKCESARRKVEREQKALASTTDGIARDQRAREACTSRRVCSRYDSAITDAQRRVVRREHRLARFRDEAGEVCKQR